MAKKIFKEKQTFIGYTPIATMVILWVALLYIFMRELLFVPSGVYWNELFCLILLISLGYGIRLLLKMRLKTVISKESIAFQLEPFHSKKQKIKLENIENCSIVETPPMLQWHGGNIAFGRENIYSFSGRNGLAITTKDGRNYFLGSKKLRELEQAVRRVLQ